MAPAVTLARDESGDHGQLRSDRERCGCNRCCRGSSEKWDVNGVDACVLVDQRTDERAAATRVDDLSRREWIAAGDRFEAALSSSFDQPIGEIWICAFAREGRGVEAGV